MPDFSVRSDSVNVEQIMDQIRARIREKRGVDYTEQQIRELAAVKLEKFLDPRAVRSDLLEAYKQSRAASAPPAPPNYAFGEETLFETHRGLLRFLRRLLAPIQKMFWNPNPLIQALHIQSQLNTLNQQRDTERRGLDQLHFEVLHNLVLETTRMSIEIKNLKMKVESLTGRLEFNERRARALESVVVYRPSAEDRVEPAPPHAPQPAAPAYSNASYGHGAQPGQVTQAAQQATGGQPGQAGAEGPGQRSRRRRRRRGRRGGGPAAGVMGSGQPGQPGVPPTIGEAGQEARELADQDDAFDDAPDTGSEPDAGGGAGDSGSNGGNGDSGAQ